MTLRCLLLLGLLCFNSPAVEAATGDASDSGPLLKQLGIEAGESHLPGIELAEGVSQITGVAISPLLGVSAIGAWNYFRTDPEFRGELPWICQPIFWGIGLGILAICFLKDSLGAMLPSIFKKPLDLIELFEDKASALVASAAFIPFLVDRFPSGFPELEAGGASFSGTGMATITLAILEFGWVVTPIALAGFFIVWIVSHTINVLIVLSPFGLVDAILKLVKISLLSFLGLLYVISPVVAAIFSGGILLVCLFLAPLAFRLSVYGSVFAWDSLRSFFWKEVPREDRVHGFLAKRGSRSMKALRQGKLHLTDEGQLVFVSRWLFFGPKRTLQLPPSDRLLLTNGVAFPVIHFQNETTGKTEAIMHLYPRFKHHGELVARWLDLEYRETNSVKGIKAVREFLVGIVKAGKSSLAELPGTIGQS